MSRRDGAPVCRWVADRVREVAPPGLGRWARAWELVEGPSGAFLDALSAWEATGSAADMEATRTAAAAVIAAWRQAAAEWDGAGRPETWPAPAAREVAHA